MLSQNQSKLVRSLHQKKYRVEEGLFLVEGDKMVLELLDNTTLEPNHVFAVREWLDKHYKQIKKSLFPVTEVLPEELERISTLVTPNQVLAVVKIPHAPVNTDLPAERTCFYLDGIQDPGNMGTILRIADWFGIPAVYCSPDCVDLYSPKVVQASMGAVFRVPSWEISLEQLLENQSNIAVMGAVMDGKDVFKNSLAATGILVIGNEGKGIRPSCERLLTHKISIPRHPKGRAESLNAAVATGILAAPIPAK